MPQRPFPYEARIRFVDTDASGRIHYSAMLRHFEGAEQEFLRAAGHGFAEMLKSDWLYPRVHVECDYLGAVEADDLLHIDLVVERVGRSSYTLAFAAAVAGRPVAKGRIVAACMNRETQRPAPLPDALAAALHNFR